MDEFDNEAALMKLHHGRKDVAASLRRLAYRVERLSIPQVYEAMVWVEPHVRKLLFESEFILEPLEGER